MSKIKIGFICVHNSCRSIMAEALCKHKYSDIFEVYSAGTMKNDQVNLDALKTLEKNYNITGEFNSKLVDTLPELDIVITMGCNVSCPMLKSKYRQDFELDDPTNKDEEIFNLTAKIIELKIDLLVADLKLNNIVINE